MLPLFIFIPGFGDCSFIITSSSFAFSPNSTCKFISNPTSFKAFFASFRFKLRISGTSTSSKFSVVCSLSFLSSKYGNISPKTCPPTGAATAPPWCPPSPVGLYNVTSTTTSGSDIGATPIKDVTYLFVFTPSSDVPVFPPTLKPFTCAFFPCSLCYNRFHHT